MEEPRKNTHLEPVGVQVPASYHLLTTSFSSVVKEKTVLDSSFSFMCLWACAQWLICPFYKITSFPATWERKRVLERNSFVNNVLMLQEKERWLLPLPKEMKRSSGSLKDFIGETESEKESTFLLYLGAFQECWRFTCNLGWKII